MNHHHAEPYLATLADLPVSVTAAYESDDSFDADGDDGLGDVPIYADLVDPFEDETPDVVWTSLSNRDTPAVIEAAVERGIDVHTEKPAARTAAELEAVSGADATTSSSCTPSRAARVRTHSSRRSLGRWRRFLASSRRPRAADRSTLAISNSIVTGGPGRGCLPIYRERGETPFNTPEHLRGVITHTSP